MTAITTFLDSSKLPVRTMEQKIFDMLMAEFMRLLPVWGSEVNAALGAFNAIAAGGVYALAYTFDSSTADADPGPGRLRLSSAVQNASTSMRLDVVSGGQDRTTQIDTFDGSTSYVKGAIRLVKQGDLSKWMTFDVFTRTAPAGYRNLTVICTGSSAASPFSHNEPLLLFFQRTGDKGDAGIQQIIYARDERASGTYQGSSSTGVWARRVLNTVKFNSIPDASLATNRITLPPGTYEYVGSAPAYRVLRHQTRLYNVSDSVEVDNGTSQYSDDYSYACVDRSFVRGVLTITSAKTFELQHQVEKSNVYMWGYPALKSGNEVYSELLFKKVA